MESGDFIGNYTLDQTTLESLREVQGLLINDECRADVRWSIINPKNEKKNQTHDEKPSTMCMAIEQANGDDSQSVPGSSTQLFFTQREKNEPTTNNEISPSKWFLDFAQSLLESLESTDDTELSELTSLSDNEANKLITYLSENLNMKGTYNLCHFICKMNVEQVMRYIRIICSCLLLRKIIELDSPSREMNTLMQELIEKFPEDVQEFVYIPMLQAELRDTSVFLTIINSYPPQQRNELILNFIITVQELKEWHTSVLSQLINEQILENATREKLLDMLRDKASMYSRDKNYGKFIFSFLKLNTPFTENQKSKLSEIVDINETVFKNVMQNLLKNMYHHGDMWHIK